MTLSIDISSSGIRKEIGDVRDKLTFSLDLPTTSFTCEISAAYGSGFMYPSFLSIPPKAAIGATAALVTSSILLDCGRLHHPYRC